MEDEINLLDYWRVMVKWKRIIILVAVITTLTAWFYSLRQPKMYKATASIMVVESGGGGLVSSLGGMSFMGGMAGMGGWGEGKINSVLKSAALAKQVAKSLDLAVFFPKLSLELSEEEKLNSVAGSLQGAVEGKSASLFQISVVWTDPEKAAEFANQYVDQLGKFLNARALNVNFQVIDSAVAPNFSFKPNVKQNVTTAFVLGLFMGIFIAFFLEYLENIKPR